MKYFARIVEGIAVHLYMSDGKWTDDAYEITEDQFNSCVLPCRADVTENGVVFGDVVPFDSVPVVDDQLDIEDEPAPAPEPTVWDEMAVAILEGVNDV